MSGTAVRISILADSKEFTSGIGKAQSSLDDLGRDAKKASDKVDRSLGTAADAADGLGSSSSQAAGGLGDLGGSLGALGEKYDVKGLQTFGGTMEGLSPIIMGATGAADLASLALGKFPAIAGVASKAARGLGLAFRFMTGPVGLILLAVAAIAAGLVLLYKKNETFRNFVNKVWPKIAAAFDKAREIAAKAFGWIKRNWPLLLAIITGPIGLATLAIVRNWDKIKNGATAAKDWVTTKFNALVTFVTGLPGRITRATSGMWNGIKNAFRGAINFVIDGWNSLEFTLPEVDTHIPGVGKIGGWTLGTPDIPRLANGGITTGPMLALIGDNPSGREAVIPLDKYDLGGTTVNVTVVAPVGSSSADIGRELQRHLDAYLGDGGRRRA